MKLGLGIKFADFGDDILHYAAQLGVTHVVLHSPSFGERGFHEAPAMAETRSKIESFGLKWEAIENLPGSKGKGAGKKGKGGYGGYQGSGGKHQQQQGPGTKYSCCTQAELSQSF